MISNLRSQGADHSPVDKGVIDHRPVTKGSQVRTDCAEKKTPPPGQTDLKGSEVMLELASGEKMDMSQATVITADTAGVLIGRFVEGAGGEQGFVNSYRIDGAGIEGVTLILDDAELPLMELQKIRNTQG